jgi:hypothetical protein
VYAYFTCYTLFVLVNITLFIQIWSCQVTVLFVLIYRIILVCGLLGSYGGSFIFRVLYSCRRLFTSTILYVCLSVTWKTDPLSLNPRHYIWWQGWDSDQCLRTSDYRTVIRSATGNPSGPYYRPLRTSFIRLRDLAYGTHLC